MQPESKKAVKEIQVLKKIGNDREKLRIHNAECRMKTPAWLNALCLKKLCALLFVTFLCTEVFAEPTIGVKIESESFVAGRAFDVTVFVKGDNCGEIEWNEGGFRVVFDGQQVAGIEDNKTHSFKFSLIPLHAGRVPLPSFWVTCDGTELETTPELLNIQNPRQSPDLTVSAAVSETEVFVGQPLKYMVTLRIAFDPGQLRGVDIQHPLLYSDKIKSLDVKPKPGSNEIGLPVANRRVIAQSTVTQENEQNVTTLKFEQILIPQESGTITLPALSIICARINSRSGGMYQNVPSYFDNSFFEGVSERDDFSEYFAETKAIKLNVKALPVNHSDHKFSGIVGKCELKTEVTSQDVKVGEPIGLTLALKTPFADVFKLPDLREFEALGRRFWIPEAQSEGVVGTDERVYKFILRPLHTGVQMIPPLELLIFNPETAKYELIQSAAISLKVNENEGVTRFVPPVNGGVLQKREMNMAGIWFNEELSAGLLDRVAALSVTFWWVWLVLPALIIAVGEPIARRFRLRITNPKKARNLEALRLFRKNLSKGELSADVLLKNYFADIFDLQYGAVTLGDILPKLSKLPESLKADVIAAMKEFDCEQFNPRCNSKKSRETVAELVKNLDKEIR